MRIGIFFVLSFLPAPASHAQVLSPSSIEVKFAYTAEFRTAASGSARQRALEHAKHLFGYLQSPELSRSFGLGSRIQGIGAPRWEPELTLLSEHRSGGMRSIRYEAQGLMLLNKRVAGPLLAEGAWDITLPYEQDSFFDEACTDPAYPSPEEFWYFNDPFRRGCEHLRQAPLAAAVRMKIHPAPQLPADLQAGLSELRGDNGNGDLFEIAVIHGFDESSRNPRDDGRIGFEEMNQWLRSEGFEETVLSRFRNRPVHRFEKTLQRREGGMLHVRITRLLAETDLEGTRNVTFAKFLKNALETSDVVIYEGHSGLGVNLDLETVERRLLRSRDKNVRARIDFNRFKRQLFFFDSCSSYSYYLGMFAGRKAPGTLAVITNGLASLFGFETPMAKRLYRRLLDGKGGSGTWAELLEDMEAPLRGNTFLLNVDVNTARI